VHLVHKENPRNQLRHALVDVAGGRGEGREAGREGGEVSFQSKRRRCGGNQALKRGEKRGEGGKEGRREEREGRRGNGKQGDRHRLTTRLTSFRSLSVISVFFGFTSWPITERMS
jgi:hypothetical protein